MINWMNTNYEKMRLK